VLLQMFTGFQLYVEGEAGGWSSIGTWWPSLLHTTTDWTLSVFGSPGGVRAVHLITMYFIIGWALTHIYYEVWRTIVWREGDIGIVFSGHKFARRPLPVQPAASTSATAPAATGSAVGAPDPGPGP
jgi:Ni/Fe-hydrogenase 1 B-type cytochrome subunit